MTDFNFVSTDARSLNQATEQAVVVQRYAVGSSDVIFADGFD